MSCQQTNGYPHYGGAIRQGRPQTDSAAASSQPVCGNCRFFKDLQIWAGRCHRHPPAFVASMFTDSGVEEIFPTVQPADSCDEHQPA